MKLDEFGIIKKFFQRNGVHREDVIVASGDDCAVLTPPANKQLIMTIDALLVDRHFLRDTPANDIGYKAVAMSLSDIAAMGGTPAWLLATLTIEERDEAWLALFAEGVFTIADAHNVSLVGGDLTRGPLAITTQLTGFVEQGAALCRDGARVGDKIYVTGTLGDAGLALADQLGQMSLSEEVSAIVKPRLLRPTPRVQAGLVLSRLASACIDISDGLAQDLNHILNGSGVGAHIDLSCLPLSTALQTIDRKTSWELALSAGDDYELCFTISPAREVELLARQDELGVRVSCIGEIVAKSGIDYHIPDGIDFTLSQAGYQHF